MEVKYSKEQEDAVNPVYMEDQKNFDVPLDDAYSMPDEALKNPLFLDGKQRTDNIKIIVMIVLVVQIVTLLLVAVVLILGVVGVVSPSPAPVTDGYTSSNYTSLLTGVAQVLQLTRNVSMNVGAYQNTSQAIFDMVGTLSNLKDTSTTTAGAVNDILLAVGDILDLQNRSFLLNTLRSCKDIKSNYPNTTSGYYYVNNRDVYCNMDQLCGSEGGWTRIGYFDMTDATQGCPDGFRTYSSSGVRVCGRPTTGGSSCTSSITLQAGFPYTQICGKVIGYQYGSPDAINTNINNLNSPYVDGVSITRGNPRKHVWTYINGIRDTYFSNNNCPCNDPPGTKTPQTFVGSYYFCESGNHGTGWQRTLYYADPLWDGQGCGSQEAACCAAPGLPWFNRDYGNMTITDDLELRVCGNQGTHDEDTPISYYEIYVK